MTHNTLEVFEVIRMEIAKKLSHVTFIKSDGNRSFWTVQDEMIKISVSIETLSDGSIEVNIDNESEEISIPTIINIELGIENKLEKLNEKLKNEKVVVKMEKMTTLVNGVEKFELVVENDFNEAQRIFDINENTESVDTEWAYNEREEFEGLGTYKMMVSRFDDYNRFKKAFEMEKEEHLNQFFAKRNKLMDKVRDMYYDSKISGDRYNLLYNRFRKVDFNCECDRCKQKTPKFEEWKNGILETRFFNEYINEWKTKKAKLGKTLLKSGFSQNLIDFYSTQIKTEKEMCFTVSDRVQHIAGMANYALKNSWDGYNGTSCQDTRHGGSYCIHLAGALHDDKLFIGMLHNNLEDVENMQDKLIARVIFRWVMVDGVEQLIPAKYYGNNETKDMLHYALNQLNEVNVFSSDIKKDGNWYKESANGFFEMEREEEVFICRTIDENIEVTCPMCEGDREITVEDSRDNDIEVTCPMCHGDGEYTINVYEDIEEYVTVNNTTTICPYFNNEGWEHEETYTYSQYNIDTVRENMVRFNKKLV